MATIALPDIGYLEKRLSYDKVAGEFRWKPKGSNEPVSKSWNNRYAGSIAGASDDLGYRRISLGGRLYLAHRLAWWMSTGEYPEFIDHINGDPNDNRIVNLRAVTRVENNRNKAIHSNNRTGTSGVRIRGSRWVAEITVDGRIRHLGYFESLADASVARKAAERLQGFHENHGREP